MATLTPTLPLSTVRRRLASIAALLRERGQACAVHALLLSHGDEGRTMSWANSAEPGLQVVSRQITCAAVYL